jgi:hypothetical protein
VCSWTNSFAASITCSAPATVCCATPVATRLTRVATCFARFVTPDAARVTVFLLGSESFLPPAFLRDDARFGALFLAVPARLADALRPLLALRAAPFFAALFRAGPRELERREELFLAGDFRPLERLPDFFPPFEPRDDFLAAAMIRAPI